MPPTAFLPSHLRFPCRLLPLLLLLSLFLAPPTRAEQEGDFIYSSDGSAITITYYAGRNGPVAIPSTIAGLPVRTMGDSAFANKTGITSVAIPDGVTSIEKGAFGGCRNLASVTIPDSVSFIGSLAFGGCWSLASIAIPGNVTSIEDMTFPSCSSLSSVTLGYGVRSIGREAFRECMGLTSVVIPDSVATIGNLAFADCRSLASVVLPDSVTSLGNGVFFTCLNLASVTLPDGITSIGRDTFYECRSLASVTIPDNVTSIGNRAFYACTSLASVAIGNSVTFLGDYAFDHCTSLANATFSGNAPTSFGSGVFTGTAPDFTIYYYEGLTGFTSPTWNGYPTVMLTTPSVPTLEEWRKLHFGEDATNSGEAADDADPDGDGLANIEEYAAGTDPKNAGSMLQMTSAGRAGDAYTVTFDAQPGRRYELQRFVPGEGAAWQTIATQEPPAAAAPPDAALYRIKATLP